MPSDLSVPLQVDTDGALSVEHQRIPRSTCIDPQLSTIDPQPAATGTASAAAGAAAEAATDAGADDLINNLNRLSESKLAATSDSSSAEDEGRHSASEAGSELSSSRESSASRSSLARSIPIPISNQIPPSIPSAELQSTIPPSSAPLAPLVGDTRTSEEEMAASTSASACQSAGEGRSRDMGEQAVKELMRSLPDNKGDAAGDSSELLNSLGGEPTPVSYLPNIMPADANANAALSYESAETNSENVSEVGAVVGSLYSARVSATSSPVELSSPEDQQTASSFRALGASSSSSPLSLPPQKQPTQKPLKVPFACTTTSACDTCAPECEFEKDQQIRADAIRLAMEPLAPLDTCCCSASPITQRANSATSSPGCSKSAAIGRNSRKGKPRAAQRLAEEEVHTSLEDVLRQFVSLELLSGITVVSSSKPLFIRKFSNAFAYFII